VRDRALGIAGVVMLAGAFVWAIAGGDAGPVGALVVIGLGSVLADAVVWRFADRDLDVPSGAVLPSPPWGFLVGPAGALGLAAAAAVGVALLAVAAAVFLVAALPGLYTRFPAGALSLRVVGHAQRVREFGYAHGVELGAPVEGYLTPVGENGARLFVFAPDGAWADLMVRRADAEQVAQLARVQLRDRTSPAIGSDLATGRPYWKVMTSSW
jgi:hypothetical protein